MTPDEVINKFKPWFPHLRSIPVPQQAMPKMTPREALAVLEWDSQCLYDGGSGAGAMTGHAHGVLEDLIDVHEKNLVVPE